MRIVSLKLKNIRSYKQEEVEFPNGLVLLAGDIGCGKSTLLLAIEFALFGLRRGEISGGSLLRHGAKEGKIALTIHLNGEDITIERGLKKTVTSVAQSAGKITKNGASTDLTAVELRARVLELLNYPESLLSQTKSLVFRYTVYTPQEHMKTILFEKPEERLDTMRKLFSIDKYKRIRENASIVGRELRTNIERLRGRGDDLQQLKREQVELNAHAKEQSGREEALAKELAQHKQLLEEQRELLEKLEKEAAAREQTAKQHAVTQEQLHNAKNNLQRTKQELAAIKVEDTQDLSKQKSKLKQQLQANDAAQQELNGKITENNKNEAKITALEERINKENTDLEELDNCPTCKQPVTEEHKEQHAKETQGKLVKITERKQAIQAVLAKQSQELQQLKEAQEGIRKETEELMREEARQQANKRNLELRKHKQEQEKQLVKQITDLENKLQELAQQLDDDYDATTITKQREKTRQLGERYQQTQLTHARHVEQQKALTNKLTELEKNIAVKERAQLKAEQLAAQHEWLTKHFSNLMFTIEKHVLMTLYHQFNDAFKEWFDALIEDDTITVRLDQDFTPLVEQNGYETNLENLSGGEKTSVALAYRLAINKVINQALHDLNTDGLLILDEPTDGFSHEQLDRVQEVLSKLGLDQILIVSHEPKMEAFMDHVIRVTKNEHESAVH